MMPPVPSSLATDQRIRPGLRLQKGETVMSLRNVAFAAAAVTLASIGSASISSAWAGGPRAHKIDLGAVNGVAYYTEEAGRFHVVATVAQREGQPIRVETVLAPGQSFVLSTAKQGDAVPTSVELSRDADDLMVRQVAVTN
jgi:hypothetical protein